MERMYIYDGSLFFSSMLITQLFYYQKYCGCQAAEYNNHNFKHSLIPSDRKKHSPEIMGINPNINPPTKLRKNEIDKKQSDSYHKNEHYPRHKSMH